LPPCVEGAAVVVEAAQIERGHRKTAAPEFYKFKDCEYKDTSTAAML
jgi:hypothetical protein